MFRPTQFVILFAVFVFAYAAPAAQLSPAASEGPAPLPTPALKGLPAGSIESGKEKDLKTDATTYLAYSYGPGYNVYGYNALQDWSGLTRTYNPLIRTPYWSPYSVWY